MGQLWCPLMVPSLGWGPWSPNFWATALCLSPVLSLSVTRKRLSCLESQEVYKEMCEKVTH